MPLTKVVSRTSPTSTSCRDDAQNPPFPLPHHRWPDRRSAGTWCDWCCEPLAMAVICGMSLTESTAARKNARVLHVRECEVCGAVFKVAPSEVKRGRGRACSMSCAARLASRADQAGANNPNWKGGVTSAEKNRRYIADHPEKYAAHLAMRSAIRRGELTRQPCEVCGDLKTDGHHDDYSKPLDVRWLCRAHHSKHHKIMRAKSRNQDRHRPGYYAEYQRKRRARIKAANAGQAQMVTINKLLDAS